jgi:N-acetylmuramoyl-L-alanine amidase
MRFILRRIVPAVFLSVAAAGCSTTPSAGPFPYATASIGQARYFSLTEMCDREQVSWDHDPLSQVVILKKADREVRLMIGGSQALVDGALTDLSGPVLLKDGVVLAPVDTRAFFQPKACKVPASTAATGPIRLRRVKTVILDAGHGGYRPGQRP